MRNSLATLSACRIVTTGMAAACLAVAAIPAHAVEWEAYTYASIATQTSAQGMQRLFDEVEKATRGELKIKLHLGGTLSINTTNQTSAVAQNIIQFADDSLYVGNIPIGGILRLPFLIKTEDEYRKATAIVYPLLEKEYEKRGILALGQYIYPLQTAWSSKKIESLRDLKGKRMRITSPEQGEFVTRVGGFPVTVASPEVTSALNRGTIDTVFTATSGSGYNMRDLIKYNYRLGLNFVDSIFVVNRSAFDKLSPTAQTALRQSAARIIPTLTRELDRQETELTQKLVAQGIVVTYANDREIADTAKLMAPYWDEWAKSRGPEAAKALQAVRAALGR